MWMVYVHWFRIRMHLQPDESIPYCSLTLSIVTHRPHELELLTWCLELMESARGTRLAGPCRQQAAPVRARHLEEEQHAVPQALPLNGGRGSCVVSSCCGWSGLDAWKYTLEATPTHATASRPPSSAGKQRQTSVLRRFLLVGLLVTKRCELYCCLNPAPPPHDVPPMQAQLT